MRVCLCLSLLVLLQAKQEIVFAEVLQSSVGLALLLLTAFIYLISSRPPKQVVEFEHFELTHPPTPIPVLKDGKEDASTSFPSSILKEVSFEADGTSPAERKKRKRKAHRLSDRRKNNESQECE
jgi:hypothetical protein